MKKYLVILAAVALLCPSTGWSAEAKEVKIGSVDAQKVFEESPAGHKATKAINDFTASRQKIVDKERRELEKMQEEYTKQQAALSADAKKEKEEALQKRFAEYQQMAMTFDKEVKRNRDKVLYDFDNGLQNIIKEIGQKEGFTVILDRRAILYLKDTFYPLDLTERFAKDYKDFKESELPEKSDAKSDGKGKDKK